MDAVRMNDTMSKALYLPVFRGVASNPQPQCGFRGETASYPQVQPQLQTDTVEISSAKDKITKKKGMSTGAKWAVGIGGTLTAALTAGVLLMRHDHKKLLKLCKDKIKLSDLPENLEYNATTREEAMKFAKETLGIKEVDESFSDLALHDTLKAIVDVSNANKGKVYIPPKLKFESMEDNTRAYTVLTLNSEEYGAISVNKKYYDDEFLTKYLKKVFDIKDEKVTEKASQKVVESASQGAKRKFVPLNIEGSDKYLENIEKLKRLTLEEKRELYLAYRNTYDIRYNLNNSTKAFFSEYKEVLNEAGIKYDYDAMLKLSEKEQIKELANLRAAYKAKTGVPLSLSLKVTNPNQTIYHEMGHLQDMTHNLENLILKDSEWSRLKRIFTSKKDDLKINNKEELECVESRWKKIGDLANDGKTGREILKENPEKYKQMFPDLYEHITNKEIQMTAGEVSWYAKEGVGEFVAEVYAKMINGEKLSDDVLALYKKYNGPLPASYLK